MAADRVKVRLALEQRRIDGEIAWPPYDVETLWAEKCGDNAFRILNTPFFSNDVSYGDIVAVTPTPGDMAAFHSVIERSHHCTVRVILLDLASRSLAEQALDEVQALGCSMEAGDNTVAVDVPPNVKLSDVLKKLDDAVKDGGVVVDMGYCPDGTLEPRKNATVRE